MLESESDLAVEEPWEERVPDVPLVVAAAQLAVTVQLVDRNPPSCGEQ